MPKHNKAQREALRAELNLVKKDNKDTGIKNKADFDIELRANNDFNVVTTPALIDILNLVQRDNDDSMEG